MWGWNGHISNMSSLTTTSSSSSPSYRSRSLSRLALDFRRKRDSSTTSSSITSSQKTPPSSFLRKSLQPFGGLPPLHSLTPPPSPAPSSSTTSTWSFNPQETMPLQGGPREASLADALARTQSPSETIAALDEYAWRSLKAGVRVREYCNAADRIVQVSPPRGTRLGLQHTHVALLFPFSLPTGAPSASESPATLAPGYLAHPSRKQLSEVLTRLSRESDKVLARAQVLEVALEYIGRRWREGGDDVVEAISKKLSEVESELQSSAEAEQVVTRTLRTLRFHSGFVGATQLVTHLNDECAALPLNFEATVLFTAWIIRRLSAGSEPSSIASELYNIRERLTLITQRNNVTNVMASFALNERAAATQWTTEASRRRTRTLSRLSFRANKRKTVGLPWLAKVQQQDGDRRPSLPTHLSHDDSHALVRMGTFGQSTTEFGQTIAYPPSSMNTPRYHALGMSFNTASSNSDSSHSHSLGMSMRNRSTSDLHHPDASYDLRSAMADHLLSLRYGLGIDADGWYLGSGRDKAVDFLNSFEVRDDAKEVVVEMRHIFGIATSPIEEEVTFGSPAGLSPTRLHERDQSFDLEQYLADIGVQDDDDDSIRSTRPRKTTPPKRASLDSVITTSTATSFSTRRRCSSVDHFYICKATRVPVKIKNGEHRFPQNAFDPPSSGGKTPTSESTTVYKNVQASRLSTNLGDGIAPRKSSLRRINQRINGVAPRLPAFHSSTNTGTSSSPIKKHAKVPSTEFPAQITPPLSPTTASETTATASPPPGSPKAPSPCLLTSRRSTIDERQQSRRLQFRQCVIVDGSQVNPDRTSKDGQGTPLAVVIALFRQDFSGVDKAMIEAQLQTAVDLEIRRACHRGEESEAPARARVVWLLEQLVQELHPSSPLGSIVEGFCQRLITPRTPPRPSITPSRPPVQSTPSPRWRRDLKISVPPRVHYKGVLLSPIDSPADAPGTSSTSRKHKTKMTSPRLSRSAESTPRSSPPSTASSRYSVVGTPGTMTIPNFTVPELLEEEATPVRSTYTSRPDTPTPRRNTKSSSSVSHLASSLRPPKAWSTSPRVSAPRTSLPGSPTRSPRRPERPLPPLPMLHAL